MPQQILLTLLTLLLVTSVSGQLCQTASSASDQLQTGTVSLFNQFGARDQTFSIALNSNLGASQVQAVACNFSTTQPLPRCR